MVEASDITKRFGSKVAVNKATFSIHQKEIVGLLGSNGAGKSTLMRMMTGYLLPDEGAIRIGGIDMSEDPIKAKSFLGYLPESAPCYSQMTVTEYLSYLLDLRGFSKKERIPLINEVLRICYLDSVKNQVIETLSKGFTHRVCLAQSIAHDPSVYVFDEPTDGLDPIQKKEIRELIIRKSKDKAIIFSTHILEEVEAVCTKVIVMSEGKIVFIGSPQEVKRLYGNADSIYLTIRGPEKGTTLDAIRQLDCVRHVELQEDLGQMVYLISISQGLDSLIRALPTCLDKINGTVEMIQPTGDGLARGFSHLANQG